ncbi:MAG TPA: hypothetical protein DIU15_08105 [Deltaproteobacteria bacterium]|nr:hypothetical protein [Deltaproteobacteria bacterium]HCP45987.1 hypothetical protein [Deltaproteobacteria bacterium]
MLSRGRDFPPVARCNTLTPALFTAAFLLATVSLSPGCSSSIRNQSQGSSGGEDDSAQEPDGGDTVSSDDDDSAAAADDDDSAAAGDDDDSAAAGDDDDSADFIDPGDAFVGVTYCIDWDTVTLTKPADFAFVMLATVGQFPLLLNPTGVAIAANEIIMIGGTAMQDTCSQDLTMPTVNPTETTAGTYTPPHFKVGPVDIDLQTNSGSMALFNFMVEGDFSGDASQIRNGVLEGAIDITAYASFACNGTPSPCYPCPSGTGQCIDFRGEDAVWSDNGEGPMTPTQ